MNKDFFKNKAKDYEQVKNRVANVQNIARSIIDRIKFEADMHIMDFGSGTGLLLEKIAPLVAKITAIDISKSMNQQLEMKSDRLACELDIIELDLSISNLDRKFDGIISSMTMHHIDDTQAMFDKFYIMLNSGGFIAISDLETEDGSFHTEDTGIFHFGFDRKKFLALATKAGFKSVEITDVSTINKPQGDYPVFLMTATK